MISIKPDGYELIPVAMTSDTAPSPLVASASSTTGSYSAYKAFNGTTADSTDAWITPKVNDTTESWLQIDFGVETKISCYSITPRNANGSAQGRYIPVKWEFQGSNDGSLFTTLDSQDNVLDWGDFYKESFFTLSKTVSYRYYRIVIYRATNTAGSAISTAAIERGIGELRFYVNPLENIQKSISKDNMQQILNTVYSDIKTVQASRIEVSNPLTTTDISQESPVGSMISYSGTNAPEHYLVCDGSEYNIADYPFLAEHFLKEYGCYNYYGGDGITTFAVPLGIQMKDVTPVMTSDTTPAPYTITASSYYNDAYRPWKAFNGTTTDAYDGWAINGQTGWIMIDFGKEIVIDGSLKITSRYDSSCNVVSPKYFILYGSNDGEYFTSILEIENETNWAIGETREYKLENKTPYRYYKLEIIQNNGHTTTVVGEIGFNKISGYSVIKYEPTYYAVNQYGGFESTVLFEGQTNDDSVNTLSENIMNYNYIEIQWGVKLTSGSYRVGRPYIINVKDIIFTSPQDNTLLTGECIYTTSESMFINNSTTLQVHIALQFKLINEATFAMVNSSNRVYGWNTAPSITKVVGIKGQLPTLIQGGVF